MKNIFIKVSLLLIIILLSCNLVFYFFKVPDLKDKLLKSEAVYSELKETNEQCESRYVEIDEKSKELENKIIEQQTTIEQKDKTIAEKDAQIKKLNQEIETLKKN